MQMRSKVWTLIGVLAVGVGQAETTYTDQATWQAAASPTNTITFDTDVANGDSIFIPGSGITATGVNPSMSPANRVNTGIYETTIRPVGAMTTGYESVTFNFSQPIMAIGAVFGSIGGSSRNLTITADWDGTGEESFILRDIISSGGFFGVIGTQPFSTVRFDQFMAGTTSNEGFNIDDLQFDGAMVPVELRSFEIE